MLLLFFGIAKAQLPQCNKVYINFTNNLVVSDSIMVYDPLLPVSTTNPSLNSITLAPSSLGLAISPVLGSGSSTPTYYTTIAGNYAYYNPVTSAWVNTGHSIGPSGNVNIAAGGGFIYSMRGFGNAPNVWKYDGTGNATSLVIVVAPRPFDLVADCEGNFYVISLIGPVWTMRKYSSAGVLLQGYLVNNPSNFSLSGGLAMLGNTFYSDDFNSKGIAQGLFNGTTVDFNTITSPVPILAAGFSVNDMATCPSALSSLATVAISPDDTSVCTGASITFTANNTNTGPNPQYQWFVDGVPVTGATATTFSITPSADCDITVDMVISGTCGQMTVSSPPRHIDVIGADEMSIVIPAAACAGDTITVSVDGAGGNSLNWNFGSGNVISGSGSGPFFVTWPTPGHYELEVQTTSGACAAKDSATITIEAAPELSLSIDFEKLLCIGDTLHLLAITDSSNILSWLPGSGYHLLEASGPQASVLLDGNGTINVKASTIGGCSTDAVLPVIADNCCRLIMPNAFSPNADNNNDKFGPVNNGHLRIAMLNIYNRWGQLVYNNNGGNNSYWDGYYKREPVEQGTYFYVIKYSCDNNSSIFEQHGDLTLIR